MGIITRDDVRARLAEWASYETERAESAEDFPRLQALHRERASVYLQASAAISALDACETHNRRLKAIERTASEVCRACPPAGEAQRVLAPLREALAEASQVQHGEAAGSGRSRAKVAH